MEYNRSAKLLIQARRNVPERKQPLHISQAFGKYDILLDDLKRIGSSNKTTLYVGKGLYEQDTKNGNVLEELLDHDWGYFKVNELEAQSEVEETPTQDFFESPAYTKFRARRLLAYTKFKSRLPENFKTRTTRTILNVCRHKDINELSIISRDTRSRSDMLRTLFYFRNKGEYNTTFSKPGETSVETELHIRTHEIGENQYVAFLWLQGGVFGTYNWDKAEAEYKSLAEEEQTDSLKE